MPNLTQLRLKPSTTNRTEFASMVLNFPSRLRAIAEGDSWFDFPPKFVVTTPPSNVIDHLQRRTRGRMNLLRLASNGDEVRHMTSGTQIDDLCNQLVKYADKGKPIDVLFFSGGGNDLAGEYRLDRVLKKDASRATDGPGCFVASRFRQRMKQIELAYRDLLDVCTTYSPTTKVFVHTYDYPYPDGRPAVFLKKVKKGPWLKPFFDTAGAPENCHRDACRHMMDSFADMLDGLASTHPNLVVVDTRRTLRSKSQWNDELHPTRAGFELIAKKVYTAVRRHHRSLPAGR